MTYHQLYKFSVYIIHCSDFFAWIILHSCLKWTSDLIWRISSFKKDLESTKMFSLKHLFYLHTNRKRNLMHSLVRLKIWQNLRSKENKKSTILQWAIYNHFLFLVKAFFGKHNINFNLNLIIYNIFLPNLRNFRYRL